MEQPRTSSRVDHVIGIFTRENLSGALSAVHRSGFGHHARVFDGMRQSAAEQLTRAGLRLVDGSSMEPDDLMIVVTAPGRTPIVAELFHETGAERVIFAERAALVRAPLVEEVLPPSVDSALSEVPDSHSVT
jgi:hypothetical protein